jgi:DNA polymerase III subunit delta
LSIDILKEDIKNKKIRNIYLFYGPEEYLKKYYLDSIEKLALDENMKDLNKVVLDGKTDIKKIIDNCETMPVFSEKKLVIVRNSGLFKSKKKSDGNETKKKSSSDDFTEYIQNIPGFTCLIFYEEEIDKRMKIVDGVKKTGLIIEFPFQKPVELVKWVIKIFKSYKKDIDQITASQMVENSEQGMNEILNEINKVVLYLADKDRVLPSDIDNICTKSVKSRVFDLTDAIAQKNTCKAIKLLDDMVILKEPVIKILFMITRQFRQVLEMKLLKDEGMRTEQAALKMSITPYAAGKISKFADSFTVSKLKMAIEESLLLDVAIKTGKINDRIAAELLIYKLQ